MSIPTDEELNGAVEQMLGSMTREDMNCAMLEILTAQAGMNTSDAEDYVNAMSDEDMTELFTELISEQVKKQYAEKVQAQLGAMTPEQLAAALGAAEEGYTTEQCAAYYDEVLEFSETSYDENLITLGCVDLDDPATINIYASTFENKDIIEDAIASYNDSADELKKISYTDYIGLMMSSVTLIINAITYVLIAFVAVSLIVSSIMIGVITLISVQERTKEIGILRAIGASKKNVSSMFNAETVIIGFASGALGVVITYLLCIPINMILHHLTGIGNLNAYLPIPAGAYSRGNQRASHAFRGHYPLEERGKEGPRRRTPDGINPYKMAVVNNNSHFPPSGRVYRDDAGVFSPPQGKSGIAKAAPICYNTVKVRFTADRPRRRTYYDRYRNRSGGKSPSILPKSRTVQVLMTGIWSFTARTRRRSPLSFAVHLRTSPRASSSSSPPLPPPLRARERPRRLSDLPMRSAESAKAGRRAP